MAVHAGRGNHENLHAQGTQWYVLYVRSRAEKKVKQRLDKLQIENFLPLIKTVRQWSDRRKTLQVPLFNSYIFVHTQPAEFTAIQNIEGAVAFVKYGRDVATLKDEQIDLIRRFIETGYHMEATADELVPGTRVKITFGPLQNMDGELTQIKNEKHFIVRIHVINQALIISVPPSYLEKI